MRRALVPLLLAISACFPRASVPDAERQLAQRELTGQRRWFKVAVEVGPLYGDSSKLIVSDQPLSELDLVQTADGKPIEPPRPERVLLPGTPVRVEKVEFPTGWLIAQRVLLTPRYHPWVYLRLAGEQRPMVLVLPQMLASAEDVRVELARTLGTVDPGPAFQALPDEQRDAIRRKTPLQGMTSRALEMAWGYPERKVIDRPAGTEEWSWPGGRRRASLRDGKLVRWEIAR
jgi:hypothetical protein